MATTMRTNKGGLIFRFADKCDCGNPCDGDICEECRRDMAKFTAETSIEQYFKYPPGDA